MSREITIYVHDNGKHTVEDGYTDVQFKELPTVRSMHYLEISEEVHNRILDIMGNGMILTENLRAILAENQTNANSK